MRRILFLLFLSLILGGRSKAQQDPVLDLQQTMPSEDSWWQFFGDSTLIRLIDKSVANNYNLQNAVKNIQLAKSRWRSQQGHFFPSFSASAQYTPEKSSLGIDHADNYYHIGQAGIEMNWEIDVFGKSTVADVAKEYGIDVLGRLPIDPKLATACDNGEIEDFEGHWLDDAAKKLEKL